MQSASSTAMAAHDPGLLFHPQLAIQVVCKDRCIQYMYVCLFAHSLSDRNGKVSISHSNQSKQRYETSLLKKNNLWALLLIATFMGQFLQDGKTVQIMSPIFFENHCDQTV